MFECGLQDTPKDVLSFFHPTPHRHRRRGKVDNHCDRNYTLKSPLSLIVTMHYAAGRSCRKSSFPAPLNECSGRPDGARPAPCRPPLLIAHVAVNGLSKGLRSHQAHPFLPTTRRNESAALPAQTEWVRGPGLFVPYSPRGLCVSLPPNAPVARSRAPIDLQFLPVEVRARRSLAVSGFSV